jgi:acetyl-CoA C-acetyltransferase
MYDVVMVGGTERLCAIPGTAVQEAMSSSMDLAERNAGLTFAAYWSFVAKAYARKHRIPVPDLEKLLANISVKNHYHGAFNKKAHFQKEVKIEDVMSSVMVAPPIKIMDCCPFSDGAAALILASEPLAKQCKKPIWVAGTAQASGSFFIADHADLSTNPAITKAAGDAFKQAGVGPEDIDVAELHDCVNIHEVICLENTGLFKEGRGIYSAAEGKTYAGGQLPVNLSGGLKSRGHPVGATGAYQLCEITQQLRGDFAGKRAEEPEIGMTVNVGGTGTVVTVNILRREE